MTDIAFTETDAAGAVGLVVTTPTGTPRTRPFTSGVNGLWYQQVTAHDGA